MLSHNSPGWNPSHLDHFSFFHIHLTVFPFTGQGLKQQLPAQHFRPNTEGDPFLEIGLPPGWGSKKHKRHLPREF